MAKFFTGSNKNVIRNFGYLSVLQIFSILLPLITYPYLIRVLGKEIYGSVVFAQAIITYFSLIINFGFNISATKEVAENKNNQSKLSQIVSSVYAIKSILFVVSFFLLLMFIAVFQFSGDLVILILITFPSAFYDFLFPYWYYQGMDKMGYITWLTLMVRLSFTALVFIFIRDQSDYLLVPVFLGSGFLVSGIISIYILAIKEKLKFILPKKSSMIYHFKESLPLFLSSASIQVYVNANRVILGSFVGMTEVAYYDLGEKVLRLLKIPVGMLGQSAFPTLSREKSIRKINNYMFTGVVMTTILIILVFIFSDQIVLILGGVEMLNAKGIMRVLSFSALMVAFSQFLGTSRLIIFGFKKVFTQIIASSGIFFGLGFLLLLSIDIVNILNLSLLAVFVEVWVTLVMFKVVYNKKLLYEKL